MLIWQYIFVNITSLCDADGQFLFVNTGARGPDLYLCARRQNASVTFEKF